MDMKLMLKQIIGKNPSIGSLITLVVMFIVISLSAQTSNDNWPQFRGPQASGISAGENLPSQWDVKKGINIKWRTVIPGLGHSSPVVWGDRVFLTTAVGENDQEPHLRVGLYGQSPDHPEEYIH